MTDLNYLAFYFLTALFFTGEAAFFATFLAGAFLAGAFIAGAGFLAAGFAEAFFAAGISYPPIHSAVAEASKLISFQFAGLTHIRDSVNHNSFSRYSFR